MKVFEKKQVSRSQGEVQDLILQKPDGGTDWSWDIRYQWYLGWKVGLHAKDFFGLGHATILQV